MTEDAQRDMEQRALRNVRGLVEKMESSDELETRKQRKALYWIFGTAIVLALALAIAMTVLPKKTQPAIDSTKLPPVKAGPQR